MMQNLTQEEAVSLQFSGTDVDCEVLLLRRRDVTPTPSSWSSKIREEADLQTRGESAEGEQRETAVEERERLKIVRLYASLCV